MSSPVLRALDFAKAMQVNLLFSGKTGWEQLTINQCLRRARQELKELASVINKNEDSKRVWDEAADVANFLLFLCCNYEREARKGY